MTQQDRVLALAKKKKILRLKDVTDEGLHSEHLRRLHRKGLLVRSDRGVYRLAKGEFSEKLSLAEVAKRVPNAVVCLLSALLYHEIGTQLPNEVWLAVKRRAALPRGVHTRLRIVTVSEPSYGSGIEEHEIDGVRVKVYCPAKTIADCFRFRSKVGLDVALEALRDAWRKRKVTMADLDRFARIDRATNVMRGSVIARLSGWLELLASCENLRQFPALIDSAWLTSNFALEGPALGMALAELRRAEIRGELENAADARRFACQHFSAKKIDNQCRRFL